MAPRGGMRPVDERPAIGNAAVLRHRGRVRHSFGRSAVLTLAADAALAALAAVLAAVRAAPPTQRKPTLTGSATSRFATSR